MNTTEKKLQAIIDSKEAIREAINRKGVEVDTNLPLNQYASKIDEIASNKWQPHSGWWNIEQIFKDDPNPDKRFILLITDSNNAIALNQNSLGNPSAYYKTSDGQTYNTSITHTWNRTQDKACALGYNTRYVIVYSTNPNVICNISALDVKYACFGNSTNIMLLSAGASSFQTANVILESIKVDNTVTALPNSIPPMAFFYCMSLSSIIIPNGVKSIAHQTFVFCTSLTSITIPNSVINIESDAFVNCISLAFITIPNSITNIGSYAFAECYSLKSITVPNSITSIEDHAFRNCYSLASVVIPNGVESIGSGAFHSCHSLASVIIPNGVESIGSGAFYQCVSLNSFSIPYSIVNLGASALMECFSIVSINIENGWFTPYFNVIQSTRLSVSSIIDMFNKLRVAPTTSTIVLGSTNLAKLTLSEIAIATNKGYSLA